MLYPILVAMHVLFEWKEVAAAEKLLLLQEPEAASTATASGQVPETGIKSKHVRRATAVVCCCNQADVLAVALANASSLSLSPFYRQ